MSLRVLVRGCKQLSAPVFSSPFVYLPRIFKRSAFTEVQSDKECQKLLDEHQNELLVVDWFATWCHPCKMIAPEFKRLSDIYSDCVFAKVDVDLCPENALKAGVSSVPTFQFFKHGALQGQFQGANAKALEEAIKAYRAQG